jgi:transposase InsO family protein
MEMDKKRLREDFVASYRSGTWSMSELCEYYGISRPTGYLWVSRWKPRGSSWSEDRSRAPHRRPHATAEPIVEMILAARRRYGWGAKKLRWKLERDVPTVQWPSVSTFNAILDRHGLLQKRRRRRTYQHPGVVPLETERANQVWPMDFKGQFKLRNGEYCYPLTVSDHYSRKVLLCHGLPSVKGEGVKPLLEKLFREVGLPEAIRTDNGAPFAAQGMHGLCALPVWWMKLGIVHQRIHPSSPQENGQHERMHRELKRETTHPPAYTMSEQQKEFDAFCKRYNGERPHESLGGSTPDELWCEASRRYPSQIPEPEYPSHFEVRKVSGRGAIRLHTNQLFISVALLGEYIGLEEIDDGVWNIVYYNTLIGRIDEKRGTISGAKSVKDLVGQL